MPEKPMEDEQLEARRLEVLAAEATRLLDETPDKAPVEDDPPG